MFWVKWRVNKLLVYSSEGSETSFQIIFQDRFLCISLWNSLLKIIDLVFGFVSSKQKQDKKWFDFNTLPSEMVIKIETQVN